MDRKHSILICRNKMSRELFLSEWLKPVWLRCLLQQDQEEEGVLYFRLGPLGSGGPLQERHAGPQLQGYPESQRQQGTQIGECKGTPRCGAPGVRTHPCRGLMFRGWNVCVCVCWCATPSSRRGKHKRARGRAGFPTPSVTHLTAGLFATRAHRELGGGSTVEYRTVLLETRIQFTDSQSGPWMWRAGDAQNLRLWSNRVPSQLIYFLFTNDPKKQRRYLRFLCLTRFLNNAVSLSHIQTM